MQQTKDMMMKTNLLAINGEITYPFRKPTISLLDIKPNNAEDGGFVFYDGRDSNKLICRIAYTEKRGKRELFYETESEYKNQGYMTEAMAYVLEWMRQSSVSGSLWLLIQKGNVPSLKIAKRYGFVCQEEYDGEMEWYCLKLAATSEQ